MSFDCFLANELHISTENSKLLFKIAGLGAVPGDPGVQWQSKQFEVVTLR